MPCNAPSAVKPTGLGGHQERSTAQLLAALLVLLSESERPGTWEAPMQIAFRRTVGKAEFYQMMAHKSRG